MMVSRETMPFFAFAVDFLPLTEMLPIGRDASDPALTAIGKDDEGVVPEELRDGRLVVGQIVLEGIFKLPCGLP